MNTTTLDESMVDYHTPEKAILVKELVTQLSVPAITIMGCILETPVNLQARVDKTRNKRLTLELISEEMREAGFTWDEIKRGIKEVRNMIRELP